MNARRTLNIALAIAGASAAAAMLTLTGPTLDKYDEIEHTQQSLEDAEREAQRTARFEKAARAMCGGENSTYELLADQTIQCRTHQGRKTITVKVAL